MSEAEEKDVTKDMDFPCRSKVTYYAYKVKPCDDKAEVCDYLPDWLLSENGKSVKLCFDDKNRFIGIDIYYNGYEEGKKADDRAEIGDYIVEEYSGLRAYSETWFNRFYETVK